MNRIVLACGLAAGSALVLSGTGAARAASVFTYTAQKRSVHADVDYNGTVTGYPTPFQEIKDQAAPDFGPFAGDVLAQQKPTFSTLNAEATQTSALGGTSMSASGSLSLQDFSEEGQSADDSSKFDVSFTLAAPQLLTLAGEFDGGANTRIFPYQVASVTLKHAGDGTDVTTPVSLTGIDTDVFGVPGVTFGQTVLVPAGSYELAATFQAPDFDGLSTAKYSVSLSAAAPQVIPLPPAAWSGLLTPAGLGGVAAVRRRLVGSTMA